ncbi:MAG: CDP-glucose 4,6-dehydratase [Oryzomonas sp.]|uniref:CDP-glucose 4,6-dehydratase n=1 Tax=Oryzomonas sp. TaxID=2855186 RepID=UPI00283E397A|nr:CDP-glucose 4,6-dehydratase [Oryzomonas sp.]MDR3578461.1 CDP-glucose 4,6-dehydratase [Oryzomonas sp.]
MERSFWHNRRVFVTGHTGFKGSWLCLLLHSMGAKMTGYALEPPTCPSLFESGKLGELVHSVIADVRDLGRIKAEMAAAAPEIVIHMAAQPLVRESYRNPVETYTVNVVGTVNLLEAVRECPSVRAVVNVTTDKCYENREWIWGYRENEPLGGYDPYSSSKACSELVTAAYRTSFFNPERYDVHRVGIASARAGNVIGGGDWAAERLIPDSVRALLQGIPIPVRNPHAIRPWQHVLEPLSGYLVLARKLYQEGPEYGGAWNFGPRDDDAKPVEWIARAVTTRWGGNSSYIVDQGEHPHEAHYLKLDCSKAMAGLGWRPRWSLSRALDSIVDWTRVYQSEGDVRSLCLQQIVEYLGTEG